MAVHAQPDGMWDKMIRKGGFDRLFPFYVILVRLPENGRNGSICPRWLNIPFELRLSSKKWHCCVEVTHCQNLWRIIPPQAFY